MIRNEAWWQAYKDVTCWNESILEKAAPYKESSSMAIYLLSHLEEKGKIFEAFMEK